MNGPVPSSTSNPPQAARKSLHIVHVDDLKELCDIVRTSLEREGHVVESYADGASGLARIKQNPAAIDVFISDHHMPKMNGLEVVRELRHINFRGRIFIFSSEVDEDVNNIYLQLKVDHVLPKPIVLPELKQLLAEG
ncbi:MAG: response regulator [Opitutae bacterium]|nr:response regulator [Opitutae bacterium]